MAVDNMKKSFKLGYAKVGFLKNSNNPVVNDILDNLLKTKDSLFRENKKIKYLVNLLFKVLDNPDIHYEDKVQCALIDELLSNLQAGSKEKNDVLFLRRFVIENMAIIRRIKKLKEFNIDHREILKERLESLELINENEIKNHRPKLQLHISSINSFIGLLPDIEQGELFLQSFNATPNNATLNYLVVLAKTVEEGKKLIQKYQNEYGLSIDIAVINSLIKLYHTKKKSLDEAEGLIEEYGITPNNITLNSLIKFINTFEEGETLVHRYMKYYGIIPDNFTLNAILGLCTSLKQGELLIAEYITKYNISIDTSIVNVLIKRASNFWEATKLIDKYNVTPDFVTVMSLIHFTRNVNLLKGFVEKHQMDPKPFEDKFNDLTPKNNHKRTGKKITF